MFEQIRRNSIIYATMKLKKGTATVRVPRIGNRLISSVTHALIISINIYDINNNYHLCHSSRLVTIIIIAIRGPARNDC